MRRERRLESRQDHNERIERAAQARIEDAAAEQKALDAAVTRSIKLYGP